MPDSVATWPQPLRAMQTTLKGWKEDASVVKGLKSPSGGGEMSSGQLQAREESLRPQSLASTPGVIPSIHYFSAHL